ncbi:tetratricopeptide repeat protein [Candidatus Thiodictyon syntrophicum]|jgi:tetratricopeptide (TPR) repeat protein|uniref:CHAT domain-containing protein n=1 Tax=Candidatus Thiodictyon syntrophicum TaxID=1166950 RepID=A0A2K8U6X3_9GAMM|nr:tetratricopeptide repeat protein [Candidatus Thiodictyon syntrophicum]AUB81358.1 hypothetical protein THSYN_10610 [Candidatus Thiodictyon syntrophicum]
MAAELNLQFPDADHVVVSLDGLASGPLPFADPFTPKDHADIAWYIETYGARALGDPDDTEAARIRARLPELGKRLFASVFAADQAKRAFFRFQESEPQSPNPTGTAPPTRLITISALDPTVLALPWELLHDTTAPDGTYLFHERLSIRRRVPGATGGRQPFPVAPKERLHLLFVVSRPADAGFLDPRLDPRAVLDALDAEAPGRVTCEFLRPPTLAALTDRLGRTDLPPVDCLHFDGHGCFDRAGNLPARHHAAGGKSGAPAESVQKDQGGPGEYPPDTGYLLFEDAAGGTDFVPAHRLGETLHRRRVALVILSACQSAAVAAQDPAHPEAPAQETNESNDPAGQRPAELGSVAARLTATGIPAVLAMTHSVLVATTRTLFGEVYKQLARRRTLGESLDAARLRLAQDPRKYQLQRGEERVWLSLQDWFIPALYQMGEDLPLLLPGAAEGDGLDAPRARAGGTPTLPETGFHGRRRELWAIERAFSAPADTPQAALRLTLTGFGGQGKTALALEAGRWLKRTGLFDAVVWVDFAREQGRDALRAALNAIGAVLDTTLADADAALEALRRTPTLVILDNLEPLAAPDLKPALDELLDAAAAWSQLQCRDPRHRGTRILCTTRQPELDHPAFRAAGTRVHRAIPLAGLGSRYNPDDALEWYAALALLPPLPSVPAPGRAALIDLFERVAFHPLSIRVLAQQLKDRGPEALGERLEALLKGAGASRTDDAGGTPALLRASIQLSLDRLDPTARALIPRLGVFQGGACEDDLLAITGLGVPDEAPPDAQGRAQLQLLLDALASGDLGPVLRASGMPEGTVLPPEVLAQIRDQIAAQVDELRARLEAPTPAPAAAGGSGEAVAWTQVRDQLVAAALIEPEPLPGVRWPYLRFHPSLAPLLWSELDAPERARLAAAHRARYALTVRYLHDEDEKHPHQARAIARLELPNLIHACHGALAAGEAGAGEFATCLNRFLGAFGLGRESDDLLRRAGAAARVDDLADWFLAESNRGERLRTTGRIGEAMGCFESLLARLGEAPGYQRALTLGRLGRCLRAGGRPDLAAVRQREKIAVLDRLEQTDQVRRERGVALTDLADALTDSGDYAGARRAYEDGLEVMKAQNDERSLGAILGQLGTLAMREGRLDEAERRYREALDLFQRLGEPASEAVIWHQLGMVYRRAGRWDDSERHYRESARIEEQLGNLAGAARTWNNLANVTRNADRPEAAEHWYRKAIDGSRAFGDPVNLSKGLKNLADLLQSQPTRLAEARRLAEESLAIKETLDPGAAAIWKTHELLARITDRERAAAPDPATGAALAAQSSAHRRRARAALRAFPGTRHRLQPHLPLIRLVAQALAAPAPGPAGRLARLPLIGRLLRRAPAPGPAAAHPQAALEQALAEREANGWTNLAAAIRLLRTGERDPDTLCAALDQDDAVIIDTILQAIADPATLAALSDEA